MIFGVEGHRLLRSRLASAIRRRSIGVLEVLRIDRRDRRLRGKSDTIEAERRPGRKPALASAVEPVGPLPSKT